MADQRVPGRQYGGKRPPQKSLPPAYAMELAEDDEDDDALMDEEDSDLVSDDVSDSDNDDDDDEEEEEDEPSERRATKRPRKNLFIDEEAEVDEDEDEEEELDEEVDKDFIDEANEAEALKPQIYRAVDRRLEREEEDVHEVAARLRDRYAGQSYAGEYRGDSDRVPMQFLLPTKRDPNLWLIKCKAGKERTIAVSLMRKYLDYSETEFPLRIKSVVVRDSLKGYVYVEARSMADVQTAIDKLNNVYGSKVSIVPINEMVDVLTVRSRKKAMKEGSWVRVLRGRYKGDLGQVVEVTDTNESAYIRLIPRIDYSDGSEKKEQMPGQKRKMVARPPQRLFNREEFRGEITRAGGMYRFRGDDFDGQGFHHRLIKMAGLLTENVTPSLEEIARFHASSGGDDQANLIASVAEQERRVATFAVGDRVYITEGDLKNAQGVVRAMENENVIVQMKDELLGEIHIEPRKLIKLFQIGDHVKVVRGKYKDDMGMITQVMDNVVTIFSDLSLEQITVFSKDIQSVAEVSVTENQPVTYKVHDFVQIGPNTVAVIIKVERDQYRVIDQFGTVRMVKEPEITQKRDSRRAVALDVNQRTIQVNDKVEVKSGEFVNRVGTILHLYRSWAFVENKDFVETSGVFVVRTRMIALAGDQPNASVPMQAAGQARFNNFGGQRRDDILHKTVIIKSGPNKGYQGIVKSVFGDGVRVQLHTNAKIVNVKRDQVAEKEDQSQSYYRPSRMDSKTPMLAGTKTPNVFSGAQTPSLHDQTRTPAWDAGAKTPAWDAGAKTPAFDGARTPAWNAGARTPMHAREEDFRREEPARAQQAFQVPQATSAWEKPGQEDDNQLPNDWLLVDLNVRFLEGIYRGQSGYITAVYHGGQSASVTNAENGRTIVAVAKALEPVAPAKKDRCVLITGDKRGTQGELIGMDHDDAIFKCSKTQELTIEPFRSLCKLHGE